MSVQNLKVYDNNLYNGDQAQKFKDTRFELVRHRSKGSVHQGFPLYKTWTAPQKSLVSLVAF